VLLSDEHWLVVHAPRSSTRAGGVQLVPRRPFVDFDDMTSREASSLGVLMGRLDQAVSGATMADSVHLGTMRDRTGHLQAWLHLRQHEDEPRSRAAVPPPTYLERHRHPVR
jgi:diadenosine tetraphosphate (Ap4A) HIT family hydrolase